MRFSWAGLLRLKPFDESADRAVNYRSAPSLMIAILLGFLSAIVTLILVIIDSQYALKAIAATFVLGFGIAVFEWKVGMRARATNLLFFYVIPVVWLIIYAVTP